MENNMKDSVDSSVKFFRVDPLTGAGNQLAFFEWLLSLSETHPVDPFTLISLDVFNLRHLNDTYGMAAGDAALRWAVLVLLEEAHAEVYRIGRDEFVGILTNNTPETHAMVFEKVRKRLKNEANLVKLNLPAATLAMIHYTGLEEISPEKVLGVIYGTLIDLKQDPEQSYKVLDAAVAEPKADLSYLINDLAHRIVSLGTMLDKAHQLAYIDSITGLPNMHAAMDEFSKTIQHATSTDQPFAILLIDGDDLRKYNKLGYLAGDEMIERLGQALKRELRPTDFIARWRTGDEFLVILTDASLNYALSISERLRQKVQDASQEWVYPITISQGVVGFPEHGRTQKLLLIQAEQALTRAKEGGKNQVVSGSGLIQDQSS